MSLKNIPLIVLTTSLIFSNVCQALHIKDICTETDVIPIDKNQAVFWHRLSCPNLYGQTQIINILDINLNSPTIQILPLYAGKTLQTLSTIASQQENVLAGINGGYFYNAGTNSQYKDPICPAKTYPQSGDLGDSLLQIKGKLISSNCDQNGDGKSHFARSAFVFDHHHVYIQAISPEQSLKNLENSPENNVENAVSAGPNLISMGADGKGFINITEEGFDHIARKAPRTAIGIDNQNHLFFVTVDGKSPNNGMTIANVADFMLNILEVQSALNMDGGGSTTMCIKLHETINIDECQIVNHPSDDSGPRKIHDGIFIVSN